jgi:hypothetical protein
VDATGKALQMLLFTLHALFVISSSWFGFNLYVGSLHCWLLSCRRGADRNRMYVASEEERAADQAEAAKAAVVALGVVLGPVVVMGALLAGSRLG